MAASQFNIYRWNDSGAPTLNGQSGSLCSVLSASLVVGYGSKSPAGWAMPFTSSDGFSTTFQNISGSGMYLLVRDDAGGSGGAREARITGFETSSNAISGSGQFPMSGSYTSANNTSGVNNGGYLIARKSNNIDATKRAWILLADAQTFYFFALTESGSVYTAFSFGDFYSLYGLNDMWRCILIGRCQENQSATSADGLDYTSAINSSTLSAFAGAVTHFIPRTAFGYGIALQAGKHGDYNKGAGSAILGAFGVQFPNGVDNSLYLSPVWVHEPTDPQAPVAGAVRGRMRGFWHLCHNQSNFTDGQVFTGSGDFSGKTFLIIKQSGNNGMYCMETSNTIETN